MQCFIHGVTDKMFLRDWEGEGFADLHAAAEEAAQTVRDLVAEELRKGKSLPINWKVLLASADDTVLISFPFSQFIPTVEPSTTPRARPRTQASEVLERTHLSRADVYISSARAQVDAQRQRIKRMELCGSNTYRARDLLTLFETSLSNLMAHREIISRFFRSTAVRPRPNG
jgi:hypothetical protein